MVAHVVQNLVQMHNALSELAEFLTSHAQFLNAHMVAFLTASHWDVHVPKGVAEDLVQLPEECLRFLGTKGFFELPYVKEGMAPSLTKLIRELGSNTLQSLKVSTTVEKVLSDWVNTTDTSPPDLWMSKKKSHEVSVMSHFVAELSHRHNISHVVDIGSGKGYLSTNLSCLHQLNVVGIECEGLNNHNAEERKKKMMRHAKNVVKDGVYKEDAKFCALTARIDHKFELNEALTQCFKQKVSDVLLCGLHTCGDLASSALRLFVQCSGVKCLCLVGCCYNLITEENEATQNDCVTQKFGFPLSTYLRNSQCYLGRNARMLASQSIERQHENNTNFPETLFYRALFQKILTEKLGSDTLPKDFRVGKLYKCKNFWEYIQRAAKKINCSDFKVTEEEAQRYELCHQDDKKKLMLFQKLRICFSPCIEGLILLDRLVFLLEQEDVEDAHIIQLFDPVISPRCFALYATKKS
ncbi:probable methyltransferase-like protein 25 isoform X2 [Ornithodoros turicata]|uniref:probable methyltransferase-like protein 25 isoform X2 n=1 Tax=Ornithodoros turicata TaxID=34597 RepID=UPI0031396D9A